MTTYKYLLQQPNLYSIIFPEKDKIFTYLSKYLTYNKIESLYTKEIIKQLAEKEKLMLDIVLHSQEYQLTQLQAWNKYLHWAFKLVPEMYKEQLRDFIALENFTRSLLSEKIFYSNHQYVSYWVYYIDKCRDDLDIVKFMIKNGICQKHYYLYEVLAIIYEKFHDFSNANKSFLDGLDSKVDDMDKLKRQYKKFEERMINRIDRDVNKTIIDSDTIDKYMHDKILKESKSCDTFSYKRKVNEVNCVNQITMAFKFKNKQFIVFEEDDDDNNNNNNNKRKKKNFFEQSVSTTLNYGDVPIFVDEPFRKSLITKGTQLVELYKILKKYLLKNDSAVKRENEEFFNGVRKEYKKKPFSWLSTKRGLNEEGNSIDIENRIEMACDFINDNNYDNKNDISLTVDEVVNRIEYDIIQKEEKKSEREMVKGKKKNEEYKDDVSYREKKLFERRVEYLREQNMQREQKQKDKIKEKERENLPLVIKSTSLNEEVDNNNLNNNNNINNSQEKILTQNKEIIEYKGKQKEKENMRSYMYNNNTIEPSEVKNTKDIKEQNKQNINKNNTSMTTDALFDKLQEFETQYLQGKKTESEKMAFLNYIDQKISQINNKSENPNNSLKIESNIKPLDEKALELKKPKDTNIHNFIAVTPERKNLSPSLSFDSKHSHLFNSKIIPKGENVQNQKQELLFSSFFNDNEEVINNNIIFSTEKKESRPIESSQENELSQYFQSNSNKDYNNNDIKSNRIMQQFLDDCQEQSAFFGSNQIDENVNDRFNLGKNMSAITEKTIEFTRSGGSDFSLDKLFQS